MTPSLCIRLLTQLLIDRTVFQSNITSLSTWADTWCMSFNITKCSIMCFNQKQFAPVADNTLGEAKHETTHYIGVIIQSDQKFTTHIKQKVARAKQQLGMIKWRHQKKPSCLRTQLCVVRLLNMPRQCGTLSSSTKIYDIEMVQLLAVRFICDLKGRVGISAAIDTLELNSLSESYKKSRHDFLLTILSNEDCHGALSYSYDELINT